MPLCRDIIIIIIIIIIRHNKNVNRCSITHDENKLLFIYVLYLNITKLERGIYMIWPLWPINISLYKNTNTNKTK